MQEKQKSPKNVLVGTIGVSFDKWLPYAAGCLISYAKQKFSQNEYSFYEPLYEQISDDDFIDKCSQIDILAFTAYVWNQNLISHYSHIFKKINPSGIVIWGGPNIPKSAGAFQVFSKKYDCVNCFVLGSGENTFVDILKKIKTGHPLQQRWDSPYSLLPSDQATSPYIDGTFSTILIKEKKIKASFETNRGCPYGCSFCDWGGQANSKIEHVAVELVNKNLDILFQLKNISELEILDSNFGLFSKDVLVVDKMIELKQKHKSLATISYSGLAKNGSPYLKKILKMLTQQNIINQRHIKISLQTHTDLVLEIANRKNIRKEKLLETFNYEESKNIPITTEMIIGLPGETSASWATTLQTDIKNKITLTRAYILSVSENTLLSDPAYIEQHKLKLKTVKFPFSFRERRRQVLNKEPFKKIEFENQWEEHRVVYECFSYNMTELKKIFSYWWIHHNFYNAKTIPSTIARILDTGITYQEFMDHFLINLDKSPFLKKSYLSSMSIIEKYFYPEATSFISDYAVYYYATGPLRTDEIYELRLNSENLKSWLYSCIASLTNSSKVIDELLIDISKWKLHTNIDKKTSPWGLEAMT